MKLAAVEPTLPHDTLEGVPTLLRNLLGRHVPRVDVQLDSVDALPAEQVVGQKVHSLGGIALAGFLLVEELIRKLISLEVVGDREELDLADNVIVGSNDQQHSLFFVPKAVFGET